MVNYLKYIVIFLFIIIPGDVELSQIIYQDISLEEMIQTSSGIFHVKKIEPFRCVKKIDIDPVSKNGDREKYPPYLKVTYYFIVLDVLMGPGDEKGKTINVLRAHSDSSFRIHQDYYLKGISKSPEYGSYRSSADFEKSDELIIFLLVRGDDYELVIDGAYETVSLKNKIKKLIRKKAG